MKLIIACLAVFAVGSISATPLLSLNLVPNLVNTAQNVVKTLPGAPEIVPKIAGAISGALKGAVDLINSLPLLGRGLTGAVVKLIDNVGSTLTDVVAAVGYIGVSDVSVDGLLQDLDSLLNNLLGAVQDLLATVVATVEDFPVQVSDAAEALAELQMALKSVIEFVEETLTGLLAELQQSPLGCGSTLDGLTNTLQETLDTLQGSLNSLGLK